MGSALPDNRRRSAEVMAQKSVAVRDGGAGGYGGISSGTRRGAGPNRWVESGGGSVDGHQPVQSRQTKPVPFPDRPQSSRGAPARVFHRASAAKGDYGRRPAGPSPIRAVRLEVPLDFTAT